LNLSYQFRIPEGKHDSLRLKELCLFEASGVDFDGRIFRFAGLIWEN
jgi:hypothetical protein